MIRFARRLPLSQCQKAVTLLAAAKPMGASSSSCSSSLALTIAPSVGYSSFPVRTVGAFRNTPALLIPPIIARIVAGVAMVVLQSLWDAHQAEAAKIAREYGSQQQQQKLALTQNEALQILNMPTSTKVPMGEADQKRAKENFELLFHKAKVVDSPYLQGKISGAYRLLCDKNWDAKEWAEAAAKQEQEQQQQQK
jgi:hypothetical protein